MVLAVSEVVLAVSEAVLAVSEAVLAVTEAVLAVSEAVLAVSEASERTVPNAVWNKSSAENRGLRIREKPQFESMDRKEKVKFPVYS